MPLILLGADNTSVSGGDLLLLILASMLPALVLYLWTALALSRVFAKLGIAGWKAWVPIYNSAVLLRAGGLSGWLLLLLLIPFFGAVFVYVAIVTAAHRINESFGYGGGMTVLAAFLLPVWATVLGFGPAGPGARRHQDNDVVTGADADAALRAISPDFGRAGGESPVFGGRPDLVSPSAWIPAAVTPAPAPLPPVDQVEPAPPVQPVPSSAGAPRPRPDVLAATPEPVGAPAPQPAEPVTSWWMPAPETPPAVRPSIVTESEAFPEESGAVSAVAGAPVAGAPRSASSAVSALRPDISDLPDIPDIPDEETMVAARKRSAWMLELPDGSLVDLTGEAAVLGRRPESVHTAPGAQLITIVEETRTVSKAHALLRRQREGWLITDLGSTNGVMIGETELTPGESAEVTGGFLLGDATLRLVRREPRSV